MSYDPYSDMTPRELLELARDSGIQVIAGPDSIILDGPDISPEMLDAISANAPEILELLKAEPVPVIHLPESHSEKVH